jgi:hypothetical protein
MVYKHTMPCAWLYPRGHRIPRIYAPVASSVHRVNGFILTSIVSGVFTAALSGHVPEDRRNEHKEEAVIGSVPYACGYLQENELNGGNVHGERCRNSPRLPR